MARCAGIWAEAQAREAEVAPGSTVSVTTTVMNRTAEPVSLEGARIEGIWNEALEAKPAKLGINYALADTFPNVSISGPVASRSCSFR